MLSDPTLTKLPSPDEAARLAQVTRQGPAWLSARRRASWKRAVELPLPPRRSELWRYTDVAALDPDQFHLAPEGSSHAQAAARRAGAVLKEMAPSPAGTMLQVDEGEVTVDPTDEAAAQGVVLSSISAAAREHPELVQRHLGSLVGDDDLFSARALALFTDGLFLYVPPGVTLEAPVAALWWMAAAGSTVHPRALVVVGAGARLTLLSRWASGGLTAPSLVTPVTEAVVDDGGHLSWVGWQDLGGGARFNGVSAVRLGRDARLDSLAVSLGADLSRSWHEVRLEGEGAAAELLGIYYPRGEQRMEHRTLQRHLAPHTRSDLLYRGALDDHGRAVYYGTIQVAPQARGTDAYQANGNLLLAAGARADTNPQLEIQTDDVRCTHGATTGPIDPEQLYYLQARGIPRPEAERLLIAGFLGHVTQRAGWSGLEPRLADAVAARAR